MLSGDFCTALISVLYWHFFSLVPFYLCSTVLALSLRNKSRRCCPAIFALHFFRCCIGISFLSSHVALIFCLGVFASRVQLLRPFFRENKTKILCPCPRATPLRSWRSLPSFVLFGMRVGFSFFWPGKKKEMYRFL